MLARGRREIPLQRVGLLLVLLGFGAFHEYAPWTKMHLLPIFKSQHVPSRWLYPATLVLSLVFASVLERGLRRLGRARPFFDFVLLGCAAWIAWDVAQVARLPMAEMFGSHMPKVEERTAEFHTEAHVSSQYSYDGVSYGIPSLPSEMANVGEVECMIFPGLSIFARDAKGVVVGLGAKGQGDPAYRGEVYTASGKGKATLDRFTPNAITVHVENAPRGDLVLLNQNWDSGWRANGVPAVAYRDVVGARSARPTRPSSSGTAPAHGGSPSESSSSPPARSPSPTPGAGAHAP